MKFILLTAFLGLALGNTISAQDSLPSTNKEFPAYKGGTPLIVIKGEEISRFPSSRFLDAVNGFFPAVFSHNPDPNSFLYVVNGNILFDINAISLFDIEEINFTRAPLDGSLFPYSKSGIFYIKTKTPGSGFHVNLNMQANYLKNPDKRLLGDNLAPGYKELSSKLNNKTGIFQSHNLSLTAAGRKATFYVSSQIEHTKGTKLQQESMYDAPFIPDLKIQATQTNKIVNSKNYLNFSYRFSKKISAGLNGLYFHGKSERDSNVVSTSPTTSSVSLSAYRNPIKYYYGGAWLKMEFNPYFKNDLYLEYGYNHFDQQYTLTNPSPLYPGGQQFFGIRRNEPHQKGYLIRNHLEYSPAMRGKFKASMAAIFSYLRREVQIDQYYATANGGNPATAGYFWFRQKPKVITLNPLVNFSVDNILTGYVGMPILLDRHTNADKTKTYIANDPYAGVIFNVKNMLALGQSASRFDIGFHYAKLGNNFSTNYWLTGVNDPLNFAPHPQFNGFYTYPTPAGTSKLEIIENKSYSVQVNSGWLNDRILTGVEWTQLRYEQVFAAIINVTPTPMIFYIKGKVKQNLYAVYVQAKIVDHKAFQWTTRTNLLIPKTRYDVNAPTYDMMERKYDLQCGWQNQFRAGSFYGQLNGLMALNRKEYNHAFINPAVQNEGSEFALNYIMIGYDYSKSKKGFIKKFSIFANARNLLASKDTKDFYGFDKYMGVGLNWQF